MNPSFHVDAMRDFLLNRLPAEEAEAIEEQMIRDEAFFSDLQDVEDELIDEYVLESMNPADALLFRERMNRDEDLQNRVALRRALIQVLQRKAQEPVPATPVKIGPSRWRRRGRFLIPGFALAAIALFLVSFEAIHRSGAPNQATQTSAAPAPGRPVGAATSSAAAVLFLPAHITRGAAQSPSILHVGDAGIVKLELETSSANPSMRWQVSIRDRNRTVYSIQNLTSRQAGVVSCVVAEVPASQLPPKVYRITLAPQSTGTADVSTSWDLQVVK